MKYLKYQGFSVVIGLLSLISFPADAKLSTKKVNAEKIEKAQVKYYKALKREMKKSRNVNQSEIKRIQRETIGNAKHQNEKREARELKKSRKRKKRSTAKGQTPVVVHGARTSGKKKRGVYSRARKRSKTRFKRARKSTSKQVKPIMDPSSIPDEIVF